MNRTLHLIIFVTLVGSVISHASGPRIPADFNAIESALEAYKITTGTLPSSSDGLEALVRRPDSLPIESKWLQIANAIPTDPWNNPYKYELGDGYPGGYGIYSTGVDGRSDTQGNDADDWNSWSADHRGIQTELKQHYYWIALTFASACLVSFQAGVLITRHKNKTEQAAS